MESRPGAPIFWLTRGVRILKTLVRKAADLSASERRRY